MRYGVQAEAAPPINRFARLSIAVVVVGAALCPELPVIPSEAATVVTTEIPKPPAIRLALTELDPFQSRGPPVPAAVV